MSNMLPLHEYAYLKREKKSWTDHEVNDIRCRYCDFLLSSTVDLDRDFEDISKNTVIHLMECKKYE